jgi:heme exporter protein CcmD
MTGTVSGGWEFVIAAYAITITLVAIYAAGTITRYRQAIRRIDTQESAGRKTQ